jgi:hypothetical protein
MQPGPTQPFLQVQQQAELPLSSVLLASSPTECLFLAALLLGAVHV